MSAKTKRFVVPVDETEHDEVMKYVEKKKIDSVASYIRSLIRADMKRDKGIY